MTAEKIQPTNPTVAPSEVENADDKPSTRMFGRRIAAICITVAALVMGSTAFAPGASAAGDTAKPDIYGCFVWGSAVYSGQPVNLQAYKQQPDGRWKFSTTRTASTNSSGCIRFNDISPGYYYRLDAYRFYGAPLWYYYTGDTGYVWTTSGDSLYKVSTPTSPTYVAGPYYV